MFPECGHLGPDPDRSPALAGRLTPAESSLLLRSSADSALSDRSLGATDMSYDVESSLLLRSNADSALGNGQNGSYLGC
jgi:hypothetical protein